MYSPHTHKERSYSCLLQLSNNMPLRTVISAPYVQYSFSETCSYVSKCPAGISYLRILVYYTLHQTSAALQNVQCQVLKNFHLTDIAIWGSSIHRHGTLLPTFDDLKSIQIKICFYPGKTHGWLEKDSTEWFIVVNSYPKAECDYQIHAPHFTILHCKHNTDLHI